MKYDLVCFSHLRWNFVYQRPQHLMSRAALGSRVIYVEEPIFDAENPRLNTYLDGGVLVVTPHLPHSSDDQVAALMRVLLDDLFEDLEVSDYVAWVYTPMAMPYVGALSPRAVVYDCMDELSNFRFAPPVLRERERQLFEWADLVFTGGASLYEAKRGQHHSVHCFPSSVDVPHFAKARRNLAEPRDLQHLKRPRVGFYGVIDERMDFELLDGVAEKMPGCEFVLVGPFAKVDPADMPQRPNLHFLGQKSYNDLPHYLAHWDVAMLPFALNDSTRFISPTKTPEYLAAGKPVVSTPIRDVVRPYGERDLVYIADDAQGFCRAIRDALLDDQSARRNRADAFVARMSWDATWAKMQALIEGTVDQKAAAGVMEPVAPAAPKGSVLTAGRRDGTNQA